MRRKTRSSTAEVSQSLPNVSTPHSAPRTPSDSQKVAMAAQQLCEYSLGSIEVLGPSLVLTFLCSVVKIFIYICYYICITSCYYVAVEMFIHHKNMVSFRCTPTTEEITYIIIIKLISSPWLLHHILWHERKTTPSCKKFHLLSFRVSYDCHLLFINVSLPMTLYQSDNAQQVFVVLTASLSSLSDVV